MLLCLVVCVRVCVYYGAGHNTGNAGVRLVARARTYLLLVIIVEGQRRCRRTHGSAICIIMQLADSAMWVELLGVLRVTDLGLLAVYTFGYYDRHQASL